MSKTAVQAAKSKAEPVELAEFYYNMDIVRGRVSLAGKTWTVATCISVNAMEGQGDRSVGLALETTIGSATDEITEIEMSVAEAEQLHAALGEAIATARGCHGR